MRRVLPYILAVLCMCTVCLSPTQVSAATRNELESKLEQLEAKEKELTGKLNSISADVADSQKRLNTINEQIKVVMDQLDTMDEQANLLNTQLADRAAAIEAKKQELQEAYDRLKMQLRELHKASSMNSMQMLFENDQYLDYLYLSHISKTLATDQQELAEEVEAELARIDAEMAILDVEKAEIDALLAKANAKKAELDELYKKANTELKNLKNTQGSYKEQLLAAKEEEAALEKQIATIIKAQSNSKAKYAGGTMSWPVPTVKNLSSPYGRRDGKLHKGIDIANGTIPIYGENIVATADGKVIKAYKGKTGYGHFILIDHGKDSKGRTITTLYAHCSKLLVSEGDTVVGGKTMIAKAGNTGNVRGPHLHFEVRVNGTAVDPIANGYLKKN